MNIREKIAPLLEQKDESLNLLFAKEIVSSKNDQLVDELVLLLHEKDTKTQNNGIKVLYEVGEMKPAMLTKHLNTFVSLLKHKNNRLQWGVMTAIKCIAQVKPEMVYAQLPSLISAATKGSVITRDNFIYTLIALAQHSPFLDDMLDLLREQLVNCPHNQLCMYAEKIQPIIPDKNQKHFQHLLEQRLEGLEKPSQQKRLSKIIKQLSS